MNITHTKPPDSPSFLQHPLTLGVVLFLLALIPRTLDLDVFVGPDEFSWVERSAHFAQALVSGDLAQTYQTGHPGVTVLWVETIGAWVRYLVAVLNGQADWQAIIGPADTISLLAAKREIIATVNAILLVGMVLIVRQVFGASVAWIAGFLLIFDPFFLTESRALRTEGLLTSFNTLAVLGFIWYGHQTTHTAGATLLKKLPLILLGSLTALALLSKVSGLVLIPVGFVVLGGLPFIHPPAGRQSSRLAIQNLMIFGSSIGLTIFILWPALWGIPLEVGQQVYDYVFLRAVEGGGGGKSFFLGEAYPNEDPGPLFYPVVLLYRTGPFLWLGLILFGLHLAWCFKGEAPAHFSTRLQRLGHQLAPLGIIFLYLVIYLGLITRAQLKYDRYVIPMLPLLNIVAALGLVLTWRRLIKWQPRLQLGVWLIIPAFLFALIALAGPHHPYYYTYWNPLLGGMKGAVKMLPVGTGGEGIDQAASYLNHLPHPETIKLASANSQKIDPLFPGKTIALSDIDGEWFLGDYTFIHISQLQRAKHDPEQIDYLQRHRPLVFSFQMAGLDYGWIYQGPAAQYGGGDTKLEGRGQLHAYDLSARTLVAGEPLTVTVYFRNQGQGIADRFYIRLVDLDGYIWAERAVQPLPGFEPEFTTRKTFVEGQAILNLPPGMLAGPAILKMGYDNLETGELIGEFALPPSDDTITVTWPTAFTLSPPVLPQEGFIPLNWQIEDELTLHGLTLTSAAGATDQWLTLYWQATAAIQHDYVLALQLFNQQGEEVAYWLGRPARSSLPTNAWQAGQQIQDPWLLTWPADLPPDDYQLHATIYDAETTAEVANQALTYFKIEQEK